MNNDLDEWSQKIAAARNSQVPYGLQDEGDSDLASTKESTRGPSHPSAHSILKWIERYLEHHRVGRHAP